ncbi:MAG TPA: alpha/beta fold hydrolase [Acidobacteriaceae bacterium]|nr:alpha/beta fold hydrolase [Acidobacteriaceae bacterium]
MDLNCPLTPWPSRFPPFHPRRWLEGGHLQTIAGNFLPRPKTLPPAVAELVETVPAHGRQISTQVLCECHWQPQPIRASRPTVLVLHGLEGSSRSQYVLGNAGKLWAAGCNVIRMNMRNCGGTERLSPTLYHSGMSGDVDAVMRHYLRLHGLTRFALIGYSMGGNLVLKLAGDLGPNAPPELKAVVGVSPAIDLAASADALHLPANRIYERRFVRALLKRFRRKAFLFPRAFDPNRSEGIPSLRAFDERITALYSGFRNADDYYFRASAARVLDHIAVPTLLIHACDDPFVLLTPETRTLIADNRKITLLETLHGGHCAFLATPEPAKGNDGYWAEHTALRFVLEHTGSATHSTPRLQVASPTR